MTKKSLHFSRIEAFIFAIKGTINNFGVWLGATLIALFVGIMALTPAAYFLFRDAPQDAFHIKMLILFIWKHGLWEMNLTAFVISSCAASLIISLLFLGLIRIALDIYHGREADFNRFFAQPLLAINLLIANIIFLVIVGMGLLFLAIPGIFAFLMLSFYGIIIAEYKTGPFKALAYSYKITRNNLTEVFIFFMLLSSFSTIAGRYLSMGTPFILLSTIYLMNLVPNGT